MSRFRHDVSHDLSFHDRPSPCSHRDLLLLRDHPNRSNNRGVSDYNKDEDRHRISSLSANTSHHHRDEKREWSNDSLINRNHNLVSPSDQHNDRQSLRDVHHQHHHYKHQQQSEKPHRNRGNDIFDSRSSVGSHCNHNHQHHRSRDEETKSPKVFIVEDPESHQIQPQQSCSRSNIAVIVPDDEMETSPLQQNYRHHKHHSPSRDSSSTLVQDRKSQNLHHHSWKDQSSMFLPPTPRPSSTDRPSPSSTNYKHWHHYSVTTSEVSPNREVMTQKKEVIPITATTKKINHSMMQQYPDLIAPNSRKSLLELKFEHRSPPHHQHQQQQQHHHNNNNNNSNTA